MYRPGLIALGVVACLLVPTSNAWADNSVLVNLGRIDSYAAPTQEFDLELTVNLGAVEGVTGVTVQAGTLELVLVVYSAEDGEWETGDHLRFDNLEALQAAVGGNWTVRCPGASRALQHFRWTRLLSPRETSFRPRRTFIRRTERRTSRRTWSSPGPTQRAR